MRMRLSANVYDDTAEKQAFSGGGGHSVPSLVGLGNSNPQVVVHHALVVWNSAGHSN